MLYYDIIPIGTGIVHLNITGIILVIHWQAKGQSIYDILNTGPRPSLRVDLAVEYAICSDLGDHFIGMANDGHWLERGREKSY